MKRLSSSRREVALLIGLKRPHQPRWEAEESLEELAQLAVSAGAESAFRVLQERSVPDPRTLIGRGKAEDIRELCEEGVDLVIFDEDLTGSQQRNLEATLQRKVIDRTGLILDIFAQRARSREGKLQVELAQLKYLLPRLTGHGADLSRTGRDPTGGGPSPDPAACHQDRGGAGKGAAPSRPAASPSSETGLTDRGPCGIHQRGEVLSVECVDSC